MFKNIVKIKKMMNKKLNYDCIAEKASGHCSIIFFMIVVLPHPGLPVIKRFFFINSIFTLIQVDILGFSF